MNENFQLKQYKKIMLKIEKHVMYKISKFE